MPQPPVMEPFGLSDRLRLLEIKTDLDRLDAVDDLWTAYLINANAEDVERERDGLNDLAGQLVDALESARGSVERLRAMLERASKEDFDAALAEIVERVPGAGELYGASLPDLFDHEFGVRELAIEACEYLERQLPEETATVVRKRERLAAGEFQPGDMGARAKCALAAAVLGVNVLDIVVTGGAGTMVMHGFTGLAGFAFEWREGCKGVGGAIWRKFRDR